MDLFSPRKLLFKAWNTETKLLMRLNTIDCRKGELFKRDHILLQFTGMYDKNGEEIYDRDVLMIGTDKHVVMWDEDRSGWKLTSIRNLQAGKPLLRENSAIATRLWSYFEAQ